MDEQKKKRGGRSRLPDDSRRTIRKEVWLSPVELADLRAKAAALGLRPGEYMRRAITSTSMPKPPVPQINLQAWQELARLAANANQYQHAMNAYPEDRYGWDRDLIRQLLNAIHQVRFALIGVAPGTDAEVGGGDD